VGIAVGSKVGEAVAGRAVEVDVGVARAAVAVGEGSAVGEGGGDATIVSVGGMVVIGGVAVGVGNDSIWPIGSSVGVSVQAAISRLIKASHNRQFGFIFRIIPALHQAE
jgi:hypothetical protein